MIESGWLGTTIPDPLKPESPDSEDQHVYCIFLSHILVSKLTRLATMAWIPGLLATLNYLASDCFQIDQPCALTGLLALRSHELFNTP